MNRRLILALHCRQNVPRERGDEPASLPLWHRRLGMFPASAGMNRFHGVPAGPAGHVPRERGDEPTCRRIVQNGNQCSPRARG